MKKRLVILGMICTMLFSCTACSDSSSTLNGAVDASAGLASVSSGSNAFGVAEKSESSDNYNYDSGYSDYDSSSDESDTGDNDSNSETKEASIGTKAKNIDDKLVYSYDIEYTVYGEKNKNKAIKKVDNAIENYNGFIENSTSSEYSCSVTVRVPSKYRDKFVEALTNKLDRENYRINKQVENLKSTYADYKRQYEIAKSNYEAYSKLLKQADELKDVLEITNYVNTAKQTMDDMERQMQDIDTDVAYSTIVVDINFNSDDIRRSEDESLMSQAVHAFKNGIRSFLTLLGGLSLFILGHILYIIVIGLIVWFIVAKHKKKKRQKQEKSSAVENKESTENEKANTSEVETITVDMNANSK